MENWNKNTTLKTLDFLLLRSYCYSQDADTFIVGNPVLKKTGSRGERGGGLKGSIFEIFIKKGGVQIFPIKRGVVWGYLLFLY